MAVSWNGGAARGRFVAPASAAWCRTDSLLEVLAARHDTGMGLTIIAQDSIRVAQYPVVSPAVEATWRPLGRGALRVATDSTLRGYQATSGLISITAVTDSAITGTIDLRLKQFDGADTVRLGGKFTRIRIHPIPTQCGRIKSAPAAVPKPIPPPPAATR